MRYGRTPPPPRPDWRPACLEPDDVILWNPAEFYCPLLDQDLDDEEPDLTGIRWCANQPRCSLPARPRPHEGHPFEPPAPGQLPLLASEVA